MQSGDRTRLAGETPWIQTQSMFASIIDRVIRVMKIRNAAVAVD
jgi:hypothetical protein